MSLRFRRWLYVVALTLCVVALLGVAARTEQANYRLAHGGLRATATIAQADPVYRPRSYLLTWTVGARAYSVRTSKVVGRPASGETIDVVFDPAEPDAVQDARRLRPYWWFAGMAPLLTAILVVTAAWTLRPRRDSSTATLMPRSTRRSVDDRNGD